MRKPNAAPSLNTISKAALIINALKHRNGSRITINHVKWLLYKTYGQPSTALFRDLPYVLQWCIDLDIMRKSSSNYIVYNARVWEKSWVKVFDFMKDYDDLKK